MEKRLVSLESVGSVYDGVNAMFYPMFENGEADLDNPTELYDVDNDVFASLSKGDVQLMCMNTDSETAVRFIMKNVVSNEK